jgi:hypothetical protein
MMTCADTRIELSAYSAGEVSDLTQEEVFRHVSSCSGCREAASALAAMEGRMRHLFAAAPVESPSSLSARLGLAIQQEPAVGHRLDSILRRLASFLSLHPARFAVAGAAVLAMTFVGLQLIPESRFPNRASSSVNRPSAGAERPAASIPAAEPTPGLSADIAEILSDPGSTLVAYGAGLIDPSEVVQAVSQNPSDRVAIDGERDLARRAASGELTDEERDAVRTLFGSDTPTDAKKPGDRS